MQFARNFSELLNVLIRLEQKPIEQENLACLILSFSSLLEQMHCECESGEKIPALCFRVDCSRDDLSDIVSVTQKSVGDAQFAQPHNLRGGKGEACFTGKLWKARKGDRWLLSHSASCP